MKKQKFFAATLMFVLLAVIATLSIYGLAYAWQVIPEGKACWEATVEQDTTAYASPPGVIIGVSFKGTSNNFAVEGNSFASTAKFLYPTFTAPTYYSGNGQLDTDGNLHVVWSGAASEPTSVIGLPFQLTHILETVLKCDQWGQECNGTWFGISSFAFYTLFPTGGPIPSYAPLGFAYNSGTIKQVPCPESAPW